VAEVAKRANEALNLLRHVNRLLDPSPQVETIQKLLPEASRTIDLEVSATKKVLQDEPTLAMLQTGQQSWEKRQLEMTHWLNLLTQRATQLQTALNQFRELEKIWSHTLDAAKAPRAPEPILQQIDATIAGVETVQTPIQTQLSAVLDLQSRVAQEVTRCGTALTEIGEAQQKAVGRLLKRETPPIWNAELWARGRVEGSARVRGIAARLWEDIKQYLHYPSKGMPIHAGLFVLLVGLLCGMRRQAKRWTTAGEGSSPAMTVFDRPFSAALVATLFVATAPYSSTSTTVRQLFTILELVSLIRLTRPVVNPRVATGLYALGTLFALNTAREAFAGALLIEQVAILIEVLAGMAVLGWALTFGILRRSDGDTKSSSI
jgi:hypothetical protein